MGNVNTALLSEVDQSIDLVVNSIPELATDMEPMKSEFTSLPPFDQKHFEKCMKATGEYTCAGPYLLLDWKKTAVKNVPRSKVATDHFNNQVFPEYRWSYQFEIVAAVPNPSFKVMAHKGGLFRVSPEEPEFAAFLKYAQLIKEYGLGPSPIRSCT